MLPLRYDSFDNDYICGKGDSSRLTVISVPLKLGRS